MNPLTGIRKFREEEKELAFLYVDEIERLLIACDESRNKDLGLLSVLGLRRVLGGVKQKD